MKLKCFGFRCTEVLLGLLVASTCTPVLANVVIDGKLDEPEWAQALRYEDFKVAVPYRLSAPDPGTTTRAMLLSTPDGIVVGFDLEQAASFARVKPRLERDQEDAADSVNFIVDFDGDGRAAYSFSVGLSGSIQDGVVSNENAADLDWDTDWSGAVSESSEGWQVEMLIPWTVAPMRSTDTEKRSIKVYFSRQLGSNGERQAFPALSVDRGKFISGFDAVEIQQYRKALFHYWPYLTANNDFIDGKTKYNGGVDLFWKPTPNFQLSATVNPDFGQVESDDLVINFDAVETFFSDRRPFFTENQSIFNLGTTDSGRLIHTRRIGGDADDGSGASDIDAAIKLNGSLGALGYGVLAASEHGDAGRDFYATRLQYPVSDALNIGWLGSYTDRPYLDRSALVQAVDISWKPGDNIVMNAQAIGSFIDQEGVSNNDSGAWMLLNWTPSDSWRYRLSATHFGNRLDFNDLGYQRRASINDARIAADYVYRVQDDNSHLRSINWFAELQGRSNDHGDRLPSTLVLLNNYSLRSGNALNFNTTLTSSGWNDLISRGNGLWLQSARHRTEAEFASRRYGDWSFGSVLTWLPRGLSAASALELSISANWYPSDAFNAGIVFGPDWAGDWLIWEGERAFGRYARRGDFLSVNMSWFPALRHELRLKTEWLAVRADDGRGYTLLPSGQMQATGEDLADFDINTLGVQLRYRYLLGPQSDVFLAYSRGGAMRQERDPLGTTDLFDEAWDLRDSDQFLAKIRYRF